MAKHIDVVQDRQGNAISGASVTVYLTGTLTLATLTDDDDVALANPVTTDADGVFEFNVDPGAYDIKVTKAGIVDKTLVGVEIATGAGGGGGTPEVVYTLSTVPGYGVVLDATVADYAALDAYVAGLGTPGPGKWVEVTTGPETGIAEVWRVYTDNEGDYTTYGPFGTWVKNPKYILGQNGETHLIVTAEVPNWTPQGSGSSRYVAPPFVDGQNGAWNTANAGLRRQQNRLGQCIPVFADPLTFPADSRIRVTCNRDGRNDFTLVYGVFGEGVYTNRISELIDDSFTGALALAGNKQGSAEFYLHEAAVWFDCEKTTNVAGIPWAFATTATDGAQTYEQRYVGSSGVVVWDYQPQSVGAPVDEGGGAWRLSFGPRFQAMNFTVSAPSTLRLQSINEGFGAYLLFLANGGSNTITWPLNTSFENSIEPSWTVAGTDVLQLIWNGSTWVVVRLAQNIGVPA